MCHEVLHLLQWMCSLIHISSIIFATKCLMIASNQRICVKHSLHISLLFIPLLLLELFSFSLPLPPACIAHSIDCKGAGPTHSLPASSVLHISHQRPCASLTLTVVSPSVSAADLRGPVRWVAGRWTATVSPEGTHTLLVQHGAVKGVPWVTTHMRSNRWYMEHKEHVQHSCMSIQCVQLNSQKFYNLVETHSYRAL